MEEMMSKQKYRSIVNCVDWFFPIDLFFASLHSRLFRLFCLSLFSRSSSHSILPVLMTKKTHALFLFNCIFSKMSFAACRSSSSSSLLQAQLLQKYMRSLLLICFRLSRCSLSGWCSKAMCVNGTALPFDFWIAEDSDVKIYIIIIRLYLIYSPKRRSFRFKIVSHRPPLVCPGEWLQ